jgi:hypothetical protein
MAVAYVPTELPINQLLLDPNNFRFQDEPEYVHADSERLAEVSVQQRAAKRIRAEGVLELKNSIISNGFLAVERLVVRPYREVDGQAPLYLVLEGNRRLAALRWIQEDHDAGVAVPEAVLDVTKAVPVIIIESGDDEGIYLAIMGVRHVGGIKQWGGYQRAKLVADLRDQHGYDTADVADRLGMTKHEVNRRYRAFKALQQMEEDEDFGDHATAAMYPIFHEAVSLPAVRVWLNWSDADMQFANDEEVRQFYDLITASEAEGSDEVSERQDPKITSYAQVRDLRAILSNGESKRILLDPSRSFSDALGIAKAEELSRGWRVQVSEAIGALASIGALDLAGLGEADVEVIKRLNEISGKVLTTYAKLTAQ